MGVAMKNDIVKSEIKPLNARLFVISLSLGTVLYILALSLAICSIKTSLKKKYRLFYHTFAKKKTLLRKKQKK